MELDLSPEPQAKLDEVAAQRGRDAKSLVNEAVERLVDYDAWFVREVEQVWLKLSAATCWNTTKSAPALRAF